MNLCAFKKIQYCWVQKDATRDYRRGILTINSFAQRAGSYENSSDRGRKKCDREFGDQRGAVSVLGIFIFAKRTSSASQSYFIKEKEGW